MQRVSCGSFKEIHIRAAGAGDREGGSQNHEVRGH